MPAPQAVERSADVSQRELHTMAARVAQQQLRAQGDRAAVAPALERAARATARGRELLEHGGHRQLVVRPLPPVRRVHGGERAECGQQPSREVVQVDPPDAHALGPAAAAAASAAAAAASASAAAASACTSGGWGYAA